MMATPTDNELLMYYWMGWEQENDIFLGKISPAGLNGIEKRAYDLGRMHYRVGDDVFSIDLLTDKEILKQIHGNRK